jgi:toxin HigB-1
MNFYINPKLGIKLKNLKNTNKSLFKETEKQLIIFQKNHFHPSLRLHKLTGKLKNTWSISVDRNHRLLFLIEKEEAYFFNFGTHDQVYKK